MSPVVWLEADEPLPCAHCPTIVAAGDPFGWVPGEDTCVCFDCANETVAGAGK